MATSIGLAVMALTDCRQSLRKEFLSRSTIESIRHFLVPFETVSRSAILDGRVRLENRERDESQRGGGRLHPSFPVNKSGFFAGHKGS